MLILSALDNAKTSDTDIMGLRKIACIRLTTFTDEHDRQGVARHDQNVQGEA